jgi:AraC-like DNA-binding protein
MADRSTLAADAALRATEGLQEWNDIVGEAFTGCTVDAQTPLFDAELWRHEINDLKLVRVRAQPSKVSRWITDGPRASSGSVLLHLQASGSSINVQQGHVTSISPGDGALCDADRGYVVDFLTPYEMFVVELPLAGIVAHDPAFDLDRLAGRKVDSHRSQLLLAFLRTAWDQRGCLDEDADWRDCVSRTSLDLAMRAISQSHPDEVVGASAELRRAVVGYIRVNLGDPDLRTSSIATALRISPRSVQSVFERLATTASGFILQNRLDRAASCLVDAPGRQSMTDLAFDCGFSDSSYFSKCFSRRFGVAPRDYRRLGAKNQA